LFADSTAKPNDFSVSATTRLYYGLPVYAGSQEFTIFFSLFCPNGINLSPVCLKRTVNGGLILSKSKLPVPRTVHRMMDYFLSHAIRHGSPALLLIS